MVDLQQQAARIQDELDAAIQNVIASTQFIKGPFVNSFEKALASYLDASHVIGCGNGTDALQIALMALGLKHGDEVILPAFTYVATAEVVALLGLTPVMTDVDPDTFNITASQIREKITPRTKAIIPVHLFGQSADMDGIMALADEHGLKVIEDNAQAIGSIHTSANGTARKTGTIGHIGTTSFYPSKNLGCYGDGGALFTEDAELAEEIALIANHGQKRRYYHDRVGVNSRLDAIQAAILSVKLNYLDDYLKARQEAASYYDRVFASHDAIKTPQRAQHSTHVFHQYTLQVSGDQRDALKAHLHEKGIPSMIYYPVPLFEQEAYTDPNVDPNDFPVTNRLCREVISLPMHTELTAEQLGYISSAVLDFFS